MNISPISQNKQNFQHLGKSHGENSYSKKERAVITGMTVLGTAASCALLAKKSGYSLNPAKMLKNIKKYIAIKLRLWYNFLTKIDK